MKLLRRIGGVSVGLLLLAAVVVGVQAAVASEGVVSSATGAGHVYVQSGDLRTFSFSAIKKPDGTVEGEAVFINRMPGGVTSHTDINCLNVGASANGNVAILSGVITSSNNPNLVGLTAVIAVQDRGAGANDPRDRITPTLALGNTFDCNDAAPDPNGLPLSDIALGNITVVS